MTSEVLRPGLSTETGPFLLNFEAEVSRLSPEIQKPIQALIDSEIFDQLIKMAKNLAPDKIVANKRFIGQLFEQLCYFYLTGKLTPSQFLLSPEQTRRFYQVVGTPEKGVTIPDGIIFTKRDGETLISAFCEYKTGVIRTSREERQMRHYQSHFLGEELDKKLMLFPLVIKEFLPASFPLRLTWAGSSEFNVVFMSLQGSNPIYRELKGFLQIDLQISGLEFADLVDALFRDVNPQMVKRNFPRQL